MSLPSVATAATSASAGSVEQGFINNMQDILHIRIDEPVFESNQRSILCTLPELTGNLSRVKLFNDQLRYIRSKEEEICLPFRRNAELRRVNYSLMLGNDLFVTVKEEFPGVSIKKCYF